MNYITAPRVLFLSMCIILGATAAWLTTGLVGKPEPRRIAVGPEYQYPVTPELTFAGDAFFLYHFADLAARWRINVQDSISIKSVSELELHLKGGISATEDYHTRLMYRLIQLGVDVDGFGKAGDWVWVVLGDGREFPVAVDGKAKLGWHRDPDTIRVDLPIDYRWCNAVNGKMLDLVSE